MNFAPVEAIANAVLFEGYMLYPYRASALKNRQRWNFGTLFPKEFAEAQNPPERWRFSAQILVQCGPSAILSARIRFLQLLPPAADDGQAWEEGFPRSRTIDAISLDVLRAGVEHDFDLSEGGPHLEEMRAKAECAGAPHLEEMWERSTSSPSFRTQPRSARLALSAEHLHDQLYRLTATFMNQSPVPTPVASRRSVQDGAFTSAHLLLGLENGSFVSLLEPASELGPDTKACTQDGVFPVLVGEPGDCSRLLCSPIILYDYPQVAPESAGDFFDGTEMDEMLALRVLTLTDEEKEEMRRGDPYARAILQRTELLPNEHWARLHGAVRGLRRVTGGEPEISAEQPKIDPWDPFAAQPAAPESIQIFGTQIHKGDRVRLRPQRKADILDMAVQGKVAIIEAIEQDLEGSYHLAVVLEDDPGRDLGMLRQVGHRFFYSPDEVEPLPLEQS